MRCYFNHILTLMVFFCFVNGKAQTDVITTVKGNKFSCKITKEENDKVYFRSGGSLSDVESFILRSEIKSIEYGAVKDSVMVSVPTKTYSTERNFKKFNRLSNIISVRVGLSLPQGKLAVSDLNDPKAGFAKTGYCYGASYTHLSIKRIGFVLSGAYITNEFDTKPLIDYAHQTTGYSWKAEKGYWQALGVNAGLVFYQDFENLRIMGRATLGYMNLRSPYVYIYIDPNNWIKQEADNTAAISYNAGATISYKFGEELSLSLDADLYKADFNYALIYTYTSQKTSYSANDVKQPFANLVFSFGLNYNF